MIAILVAAGIAVFASRITGKISGLQQGVQMRVTGVAIRWALLGISVMLGVMMLRLISFHATDALLYRGPIRLNWILDIGATALTGWAAIRYANALRNSDSGQSSRFR
ncbi:MAG: hypothetical protein N2423_00850 [Novosphingobium sp.]|nr:hypothetical protein [Novosphingobium sp.]